MRNKKSIINLAMGAVFAALIALMTSQIKMPTGINEGYLHFGDCMIYLAACTLPLPYALLAAAIGGATADILAGAAVWAIPTAIIKAINALPFALIYKLKLTKSPQRILNKQTAFMPLVSGFVTVFGYLLAEGLMYSFRTAWMSAPLSCVQALGSAIIWYIAAAALDKMNFKSKIYKGI